MGDTYAKNLRTWLFGLSASMLALDASAQCEGTWESNSSTLDYLCANGPFLTYDLGAGICPDTAQATYTPTAPVGAIEFFFSALGTAGTSGSSRMAVFLNGNKVDLGLACRIELGCQSAVGTYAIADGCLVDETAGSDGGISGTIQMDAAAYGLASITTLGVAVSEPSQSGTIFQAGQCHAGCTNGLSTAFAPARLSVAPDPFSSSTQLMVDRPLKNAVLTLFNAQGQLVKRMSGVNGRTLVLDRGDLPGGLYHLHLSEGARRVAMTTVVVADH